MSSRFVVNSCMSSFLPLHRNMYSPLFHMYWHRFCIFPQLSFCDSCPFMYVKFSTSSCALLKSFCHKESTISSVCCWMPQLFSPEHAVHRKSNRCSMAIVALLIFFSVLVNASCNAYEVNAVNVKHVAYYNVIFLLGHGILR